MIVNFAGIWNASMEASTARKAEPRNYCYASEIGQSFVTRWLRMKGVEPTNPPNSRSRRKFTAGSTLEWIVELVLRRAGLLIETQQHTIDQIPGCLPTTGRLDFIFGGVPKLDEAMSAIESLNLPEQMYIASKDIVEYFTKTLNGASIQPKILEVKSLSSNMFSVVQRTGKGLYHHDCQAWHYSKCLNLPAELAYIDRECLLIEEFEVTDSVNPMYEKDIRQMTEYFNSTERPPLDPEVFFDTELMKFSKQFMVEYSPFLTMLYGYLTPEDYRAKWDKTIASYNRTFKRCVSNANLTKLNLSVIDEAKKLFPAWDEYVDLAKSKGITTEEETEE